jgi:hypothetical protein
MNTYFIRHGNLAVTTSVLDRLRHQHLVAIHYPRYRGRMLSSDNLSLNPAHYTGKGEKAAINSLNRLAENGGYIFAEYRGSTQVLVGVVRPQQPKISRTRWSDRNREALLKTLRISQVKTLNALNLSNVPPKPARGTIAEWHKAKTFVSRLLAARSSNHKRSSLRPDSLSKELEDTAEYLDEGGAFDPNSINDARQRTLTSIAQRQGQPEFRQKLLRAYGNKCAISGCDVEPALEAAHIMKYRGPKTNHVQNGILLRADLHVLFDLRLLTINTRGMKVMLHHSLRSSYCAQFHGKPMNLPARKSWRPSNAALMARRKQS